MNTANDNGTPVFREVAAQLRLSRGMLACGLFEATRQALAKS